MAIKITAEEYKKKFGELPAETTSKQPMFAIPSLGQLGSAYKGLAVGAGKGFLEGAYGTSQLFEAAGKGVMAAVDPTKTYADISQKYGFSEADNNVINQQLKATNNSEKTGKVLGFVAELLYPVGKTTEVASLVSKSKNAVGASFKGIGSRFANIGDDAIEGGTKIKDKIGDLLVNLDQKTKTALDRTPVEKFQEVVEQGKKAMISDGIPTPLEIVGNKIIDGLKQIKSQASSIGKQKSDYLNQARIGLQRVGSAAREATLETKKIFNNTKMDSGDKKTVNAFFNELKKLGENPTLKEVDKTIDLLQDSLYKAGRNSAVEVSNRIIGPLKGILGKLNGKVGEIGGSTYKNYNKKYGELMDIVIELNARVGKEGGGAGSFVKRLFSPSDARTKELFDLLQKNTGVDYLRDARLAKFVMEAVDDVRAATLLDLPTNIRGAAGKAFDYVVNKVSDPLKAAERYINKKGVTKF